MIAANADVEKGTSPTMKGATPLFIACHRGRTEIVAILLAAKADVNQPANNGATPLYLACQEGHTEIAKKLLAAGADVNQAVDGATPLFIAC